MSGVCWTGVYGRCCSCGNWLSLTAPVSDRAICYHGKYGCVNDGKHYIIYMPLMTELPPDRLEAQPAESAQ